MRKNYDNIVSSSKWNGRVCMGASGRIITGKLSPMVGLLSLSCGAGTEDILR